MKLQEENENLKVKLNDAIETVHSFTEIKNVAFENYDVKIDYHYTPAGSYRRSGSIEKTSRNIQGDCNTNDGCFFN